MPPIRPARPRLDPGANPLWLVLLTMASVATTLVLACATPFTALAAIAATRLPRREGVVLMLLAWTASQLVGFCLLGFPHDPETLGWAVALCLAAVASLLAAAAAVAAVDRLAAPRAAFVRLVTAYAVAAIAFKAVILLCSLGLGGVATALSPRIFAQQFVRNGAILAGLLALYHVCVAIGLPALRRPARAVAA